MRERGEVIIVMQDFPKVVRALALLLCFDLMAFPAYAFHGGGVGACDACHSMHNASSIGGESLLRASDPSSVCLHCHQQFGDAGPTKFHVSTPQADMPPGYPPKQLTPAGDFGWLRKTYTWLSGPSDVPQYSYGDRHGHNITAMDYQYNADMINVMAPQGTYPGAGLSCISCHDPHGTYRRDSSGAITTGGTPIRGSGSYASSPEPQPGTSVGVYRLLGGRNYQPKSLLGNFAFQNDPPAAVSPDLYNRAETGAQTRVAYGSGMSEWCENCHTTMHTVASTVTPTTPPQHPVGNLAKLGATVSAAYNAYVKTGVLTGTPDTAFLSLVPFEEGTGYYPTLKAHAKSDDSYLFGPDVNAQVMCLTCHRAHASGWDNATRWNTNSEFIVYNGFYSQDSQQYQPYGQGRTEAEAQKAYYDMQATRFAASQDSLCHKCHTGTLP